MRIIVCVKHDLFGALALNQLLPSLLGHDILLLYAEKVRPGEDTIPELALSKRLDREFPLGTVFPKVETAGAPRDGRFLTFRQIGERLRAPSFVVRDLKRLGGGAVMEEFQPDLVLSIRFSLIFPKRLIALPRHGIINVHPGRLPAYGGLFAPFHQMRRAEPTLGCSIHWVDEGIDTGPILSVEPVPLDRSRSMMWHAARLYEVGVERLRELVAQIALGDRPAGEIQDNREQGYFRYPTLTEFQSFQDQGFSLATRQDYLELLAPFCAPRDLAWVAEAVDQAALFGACEQAPVLVPLAQRGAA